MPTRKLPLEWHDCIRAMYRGGVTQVEIARALGFSRDRIRQVCNYRENQKDEATGQWRVAPVIPSQRKGNHNDL